MFCGKHYFFVSILLFVALVFGILFSFPSDFQTVMNSIPKTALPKKATVVIDAGHGGSDPGKIGTTGVLEKDVNLAVALQLKKLLESADIEVLMTRTTDQDLSSHSSYKKVSDLKARVAFIQNNNPDFVISIHQNSFPDSQIEGAQCFYYSHSKDSEALAALLQKQIISTTRQVKSREIKGNQDYYLLKNSPATTVIVECGFLSNPKEEALLSTEEYQKQMAWAIHLGVLQFLNQK